MSWSLQVVTPPAAELVSVAEARAHLRVDHTHEDVLVAGWIAAARTHCEQILRKAIGTQTLRLTVDRFPPCGPLRLPRPPLQSVTSVSYRDADDASQTWSSSLYLVQADAEPAEIEPAVGESWPTIGERSGAVQVLYVAGYTATTLPATVRQAMLLLVGHWYESRSAVLTGTISKPIEFAVDALLGPDRLLEV